MFKSSSTLFAALWITAAVGCPSDAPPPPPTISPTASAPAPTGDTVTPQAQPPRVEQVASLPPLRVTHRLTLSQGELDADPDVVTRQVLVYRIDVLEIAGEHATVRLTVEQDRTETDVVDVEPEVEEGERSVQVVTCHVDELALLRSADQARVLPFLPGEGVPTVGKTWTREDTLHVGRLPLQVTHQARCEAGEGGPVVFLETAGTHRFEDLEIDFSVRGEGHAVFDPAHPRLPRQLKHHLRWTAIGGEGVDTEASLRLELSCSKIEEAS